MFRKLILTVVMAVNAPVASSAQSIKALVCEFTVRHVGELAPAYKNTTSPETMTFTYAALNSKAQKAQMIGSGGASDVTMYVQPGQVQFVEFTATGNMTVTSVFLSDDPAGNFASVHSRHMTVLERPIVSQYTGTCSARQ